MIIDIACLRLPGISPEAFFIFYCFETHERRDADYRLTEILYSRIIDYTAV